MKRISIKLEPDWGIDLGISPMFEIQQVKLEVSKISISGVVHGSIKIGDKLSRISQSVDANELKDLSEKQVAIISMQVQSIVAYHTNLNRVNSGMKAQITFVGNITTMQQILEKLGWFSGTDNIWQAQESTNAKLFLIQ